MAKVQAASKPKKNTVSSWMFKVAVASAAVYLVISFVGGQMQVAAKQKELQEITAQVNRQAEENRELQSLIESDDEAAYIERVARERLGYALPHERVFIDLAGE